MNGNYEDAEAGDLFGDGVDDMLWMPFRSDTVGPVNVWDQTVVEGGSLIRIRDTLPPKFWQAGTAVGTRQADAAL